MFITNNLNIRYHVNIQQNLTLFLLLHIFFAYHVKLLVLIIVNNILLINQLCYLYKLYTTYDNNARLRDTQGFGLNYTHMFVKTQFSGTRMSQFSPSSKNFVLKIHLLVLLTNIGSFILSYTLVFMSLSWFINIRIAHLYNTSISYSTYHI